MATKKKKVNWPAIKKRYLNDELPSKIAPDYEGLTANAISQKACYEGWREIKKQIFQKVEDDIYKELKKLSNITIRVHTKFMQKLEGQMKDIQNPYLFDGERVNGLFQTAMNNSVKLTQSSMKADEENPEEEATPGFHISLDAPD